MQQSRHVCLHRFLAEEGLPLTYRQQVMDYVLNLMGRSSPLPAAGTSNVDPFTGSGAYIPGASAFPAPGTASHSSNPFISEPAAAWNTTDDVTSLVMLIERKRWRHIRHRLTNRPGLLSSVLHLQELYVSSASPADWGSKVMGASWSLRFWSICPWKQRGTTCQHEWRGICKKPSKHASHVLHYF